MIPPFAEYIQTLARAAERYNRQAFRQAGLRGGHGDYIRTVCRNPGLSQEELVDYVGVNKSNVARSLAQLEREGYVERRESTTDRRRVRVYPTDRAYELLPLIVDIQSDWRAVLTDGFSPEEREQFAELLQRAVENTQRHVSGDDEELF